MSVWRGVLLAATTALPACASIEAAFESALRPNRVASAPPVAVPDAVTKRPVAATPARPPSPEPTRTAPGPDPSQLVGLGPVQLEALLGPPHAVHDEPPAKVWSYRAGQCSLDVFFFMNVETKAMKALAYDLKPPQSTPAGRSDCFDSIVAETRDRR